MPACLSVDNVPVPSAYVPLWFHIQGLQETASGYGRRLTTPRMVYLEGRWRRVYVCCYSNSGTAYVEGERQPNGRRAWRIVCDDWTTGPVPEAPRPPPVRDARR